VGQLVEQLTEFRRGGHAQNAHMEDV
jgi:hypothetical protein